MTAVVSMAKPALQEPFGINYLWDPAASVAIGAVSGAAFVREIFTGVFASDMGIWAPDCATPARMRRNLNCQDMKLSIEVSDGLRTGYRYRDCLHHGDLHRQKI